MNRYIISYVLMGMLIGIPMGCLLFIYLTRQMLESY